MMHAARRGFTLVEVLVALAILAVALAAASRASAMMADSSSELRERLLAGWVAQNRQPQTVNDTSSDPRFAGKFDKASGFTTRSLCCVPMIFRGSWSRSTRRRRRTSTYSWAWIETATVCPRPPSSCA